MSPELRWHECDELDDPIQQIACRTSKLNDGFHTLSASVVRLHERQLTLSANQTDLRDELRGAARSQRVLTVVGAVTTAAIGAGLPAILHLWSNGWRP